MANLGTMMNWGGIKFVHTGLTFDQASRSEVFNWATIERMGVKRRPAKQFVGPGDDTLTLSGVIFTLYNPGGGAQVIGTNQLEQLRKKGSEGSPAILMDGVGNIKGKYILTKIDSVQTNFHRAGIHLKETYTLSFERYGDDGENS